MIDKLEMFIALANERHFGRAAEVCRVTQPSLSSAIRQLEDQLGVQLVFRGSRFQGLTPEGQRVLDWARRIVGDVRALRDEMRSVHSGLSGNLRIGVIPTALPMIADLTAPFAQRHPNVQVSILSRTSAEILSGLESLELDAGITYLDNEPLGRVTQTPLYQEFYRFLCTAASPLFQRPSVTWAEVSQESLCLLTPDMQNRRIVDRIFREVGCTVEPILETSSIVVLASHVRTGYWSTIMPKLMAEELWLPATVRAIPIVAPEVANLVGLVVGRRDPQPPLTTALVAEARVLATTLGAQA